jgi:hypothetical protein
MNHFNKIAQKYYQKQHLSKKYQTIIFHLHFPTKNLIQPPIKKDSKITKKIKVDETPSKKKPNINDKKKQNIKYSSFSKTNFNVVTSCSIISSL